MSLFLFAAVCGVLLLGYPVALSLGGTALIFAGIGLLTGTFDGAFLSAMPNRLYGIMTNVTLIAVPLFVFMGVVLEKSRIAEDLAPPAMKRWHIRIVIERDRFDVSR